MNQPALPDVVSDTDAENPLALQWVGMEGIAIPLQLPSITQTPVLAKADVYVGLDSPSAKGIHMSRLHKLLIELAAVEFTQSTLDGILSDAIASQNGIGHTAKLAFAFELLLNKSALLSDESGYQSYPVTVRAEKGPAHTSFAFELTIPYSSTCPCSAALARQLVAKAIDVTFSSPTIEKSALLDWVQSEAGSVATPHSQRSYLYLRVAFTPGHWPDLPALITHLEGTLITAVQTAVKRQDEQEFARLNGENLMFCEDAARRVKAALERMPEVQHYWFKVEHQESLHAHNAVAIDSNGSEFSLL